MAKPHHEKYIAFPRGVDSGRTWRRCRKPSYGRTRDDGIEDYVSDKDEAVVDSHVDVDIPNGTEGRVKEVAKGLVGADGTEAVVPVPKLQSTKATKKPDF